MKPSDLQVVTLSNGMTIVTEERHQAPVVSFWMGYRIGSRNEVPGMTGAAHWIEHMLFKPTELYPGNERDRVVSREGGMSNAFTWIDGTAYFSTLPAPKADILYRMEADRMANSVFDPAVVEAERTVILAERRSYENHPDWRLSEEVVANSFRKHPYRHEVIGIQQDLERLSRDDLYNTFARHYVPNNAVAVAVGSFDTSALCDCLTDLFGAIRPGLVSTSEAIAEGPPDGEHRLSIEGPGATGYLQMSYRAPTSSDPDFVPALILGTILGGPIGLGMDGSAESRSSRLYRALVETELAVDVSCSMEATIDPFLIDISAVLWVGKTHEEAELAIETVLNDLASQPVGEAEMDRARKQALAQFVYANERVTNRAMMLTMANLVFTMDMLADFPKLVMAVDADDVIKVAKKLFERKNRVVGRYLPKDDE